MAATEDMYARVQAVLGGGDVAPGADAEDGIVGAATVWFAAAVLVEIVASAAFDVKLYKHDDTISNLSAGVMSILLGSFLQAWNMLLYNAMYELVRDAGVPALPPTLVIALAFPLIDLGYYWFHRLSHEVQIMWIGHGVHHSGFAYNLSTALRQGTGEKVTAPFFYMHLAALQLPPSLYQTAKAWHTVYQFWPHTDFLAGNLPAAVEFVFNTPAHHRVHHARNARYLRKNFAGMFVLWDRLHGTFMAEHPDDPCVFDQPALYDSFNPLWEQVAHTKDIAADVAKHSSLSGKAAALIMRPPKPVSTPHIEAIQGGAQGPTRLEVGDTRLTVYTTAHFVLSLVAFLLGNGRHDNVGAYLKAFVFVTLCSIGLLLDGRRRGFKYEAARLVCTAIAIGPAAAAEGAHPLSAVAMAAGAGLVAGVSLAALSGAPPKLSVN